MRRAYELALGESSRLKEFCDKGLWRTPISARCARGLECGSASPLRQSCILLYSKAATKGGDLLVYAVYKPEEFLPSEFPPPEQNRAFGLLHTMDDIIFYQPPLAPRSQHPHLPDPCSASNAPSGPIPSLSVRPPALSPNPQNWFSKDYN